MGLVRGLTLEGEKYDGKLETKKLGHASVSGAPKPDEKIYREKRP